MQTLQVTLLRRTLVSFQQAVEFCSSEILQFLTGVWLTQVVLYISCKMLVTCSNYNVSFRHEVTQLIRLTCGLTLEGRKKDEQISVGFGTDMEYNKQLSYRQGTTRFVIPVEILPVATPTQETHSSQRLRLHMTNPCTKFEVSSVSRCEILHGV